MRIQPSQIVVLASKEMEARGSAAVQISGVLLHAAWHLLRCKTLAVAIPHRLPNGFSCWDLALAQLTCRSAGNCHFEGHFLEPGLPQGGGARPCPTDHASYLSSYTPQDIPSWWGVSSTVIHGQSKSGCVSWCDAQPQGAQFVDSAAIQHVGRTALMVGSIGERSEDATLTARPAFRDYGSYGSYGGLDAASERAPEAVLATSYSWWQRGSTPRWGFHGLLPLHGVAR